MAAVGKTNTVIEALHIVFGVDTLDGHHSHQDLTFGDARWIAG